MNDSGDNVIYLKIPQKTLPQLRPDHFSLNLIGPLLAQPVTIILSAVMLGMRQLDPDHKAVSYQDHLLSTVPAGLLQLTHQGAKPFALLTYNAGQPPARPRPVLSFVNPDITALPPRRTPALTVV